MAEITHVRTGREIVCHEFPRDPREKDLSPVPGRADARCSMDTKTDVSLFSDNRLGRVKTHAHPHLLSIRPFMGDQRILSGEGRANCVLRASEGDEESVALRIDLPPARLLEDGPEDPLVLFEDAGVAFA
jgi:hypothetical protein